MSRVEGNPAQGGTSCDMGPAVYLAGPVCLYCSMEQQVSIQELLRNLQRFNRNVLLQAAGVAVRLVWVVLPVIYILTAHYFGLLDTERPLVTVPFCIISIGLTGLWMHGAAKLDAFLKRHHL